MQMLLSQQHKSISEMILKYPNFTGKNHFIIGNIALGAKAHLFQYKVLHNILYANIFFLNFEK